MRTPTLARSLKRSRLLCSSAMREGAALKRRRTLNDIMITAERVTEKMKVKEDEAIKEIDVMDQAVSSEPVPQDVETMRKTREAMYTMC